MATTATFLTEFRSSMTFEYKTASDIAQTDVINNMAPQHQQQVPMNNHKSPEMNSEIERSSDLQHSPGSSRGTSLASSPALPMETTGINGMNHDFSRDGNLEDPMSDDSVSMPNDLSGYNGDQDEMPSPLAQLQCALEKNGMLGKKLNLSAYPGADNARIIERNGLTIPQIDDHQGNHHYDEMMYKCHICSYTSSSKSHFNSHMNSHFDHKCPFCDYTSRTEGRLKRHVKDFHSETPPESWAGTRVPRNDGSGGELSMDDSVSSTGNNNNNKPRTYRCKQCGFVAYKKNDFWEHNKTHIKAEKLLTCPQCAFVTEYKHHLEYHIRNHFGSKPFKCGKCNYSCVNKSMLNSHMKSHSNIYQYRCANCSYATKYCHSLKLHLRKYDHKPASVLNMDGTPNPYPVIDVYGTRRGPRPKKRKYAENIRSNGLVNAPVVSSQASMTYPTMAPMVPSNLPMLYPPQFFNGYHGNVFIRPPMNDEGFREVNSHGNPRFGLSPNSQHLKCLLCDFSTDHQEMFHKHMILHAAKENQDLIKLYGINSETILQMQEQQMAASNYLHHHNKYIHENGVYKVEMESKGMKLAKAHDVPQIANPEPNFAVSNSEDVQESVEHKENEFRQVPKEENYKNSSKSDKDELLPVENCSQNEDDCLSNKTSRSVIVSHKTAVTKPSTSPKEQLSSQSKIPENRDTQTSAAESSPLDLSNGKTNDCRSPIINEDTENVSICPNEMIISGDFTHESMYSQSNNNESPHGTHAQPRNRRKGKAFKLDRYLQYEDHNSPQARASNSAEQKTPLNHKLSQNNNNNNNEMFNSTQHYHVPDAKPETQMLTGGSSPEQKHQKSEKFLNVPTSQTSISSSFGDPPVFTIPSPHPPNNSTSEVMMILQDKVPTASSKASLIPLPKEKQLLTKVPQIVPKTEQDFIEVKETDTKWQDAYMCTYCDMAFRDCVMYTMHMGYHGYSDPYTCNMCGYESKDKVEFFLHIARAAHT